MHLLLKRTALFVAAGHASQSRVSFLGDTRRKRRVKKARPNYRTTFPGERERKQSAMWSSTRPVACMNAYMMVLPTKRKPRRLRSWESASDSGLFDGMSRNCFGRVRRDRAGGAKLQM